MFYIHVFLPYACIGHESTVAHCQVGPWRCAEAQRYYTHLQRVHGMCACKRKWWYVHLLHAWQCALIMHIHLYVRTCVLFVSLYMLNFRGDSSIHYSTHSESVHVEVHQDIVQYSIVYWELYRWSLT